VYGYEEIRTPLFEHTELFTRSSGETSEIVSKQMYTFQDRGDESLTLRPEGTAPIGRAYLEHGLGSPGQLTKLCYLAPNFRYERPQAGRYRQHHQVGLEALGSQDPALDAEVLCLADQLFQDLGIPAYELVLNSVGCPQCRPAYRDALRAYFEPHLSVLGEDDRRRLEVNPLRILDSKDPECVRLGDGAPGVVPYLCQECADHFSQVQGHLNRLGIAFILDKRLVRGLDYYTKTAFEFRTASGLGSQNSFGGGGRYDGLVESLGGPPTPGVGFGSGIERLLLVLEAVGVEPQTTPSPIAFVAPLGDGSRDRAVELLAELRRQGVASEMGYGGRSLKSQMKQADKSGARYALLLGEDELAKGEVAVRDLKSSTQESWPLNEVTRRLASMSL
jgi:histidyl-tRNA synthetase